MQFRDGVAGLALGHGPSIGSDDLLIAISYHPYAEETVHLVDAAVERGAHILSLSDSLLSPIAKSANLVLTVHESEVRGFRSLAASMRSEEHTSELQSLMRISYAVFCLKKKKTNK